MLNKLQKIKNKKILFFIIFIVLDTFALLLFGKSYSKFTIINNIYLHDLLIFSIFLIALPLAINKINRFISIEILAIIAILYFGYSLLSYKKSTENYNLLYYTIRQFMIFGYLIFYYIIIKAIAINNTYIHFLVKFIILFSKASIIIQTTYVLFQLLINQRNPFFRKYYFSPILMLGIIIFAAYVLYKYKAIKKWLLYLFTFIVSLTTGHDSVYLSLIVLLITYWFIFTTIKGKFILTIFSIIVLFFLFYKIPTFQDANAEWRLYYWRHAQNKILVENYFFLGEGFGIEYFKETQREYLNNIMIKYGHNFSLSKLDKITTPFHNSFLTIMFHTGGISILLLFYPLIKFLKQNILLKNPLNIFLFTALIGLTIFSFFNVILELPHSSGIYWIVFFTLLNNNKIIEN